MNNLMDLANFHHAAGADEITAPAEHRVDDAGQQCQQEQKNQDGYVAVLPTNALASISTVGVRADNKIVDVPRIDFRFGVRLRKIYLLLGRRYLRFQQIGNLRDVFALLCSQFASLPLSARLAARRGRNKTDRSEFSACRTVHALLQPFLDCGQFFLVRLNLTIRHGLSLCLDDSPAVVAPINRRRVFYSRFAAATPEKSCSINSIPRKPATGRVATLRRRRIAVLRPPIGGCKWRS
jgi:hypothetical protein